jgi:hypothetical protein
MLVPVVFKSSAIRNTTYAPSRAVGQPLQQRRSEEIANRSMHPTNVTKDEGNASLLSKRFDAAALGVEAISAIKIIHNIQLATPSLDSWINFPVLNRDGDPSSVGLEPYEGPSLPTPYAGRLPFTMEVIQRLSQEGFDINYARIAVLLGRDVLRPHIDMHPSTRLILPFTEQGTDFRHVFGSHAVAMRAGELWAVHSNRCHGAANISPKGYRVALLVDARPRTSRPPARYLFDWRIPLERCLERPPWNEEARREMYSRAKAKLGTDGPNGAEREWHFTAFQFDVTPQHAYEELASFCRHMATGVPDSKQADLWNERARFWTRHNCAWTKALHST